MPAFIRKTSENESSTRATILRGQLILIGLWGFRLLSKIKPLQKWYYSLLIHLLRNYNIFDSDYYLSSYEDVASARVKPLRHYVIWGDKESRSPFPGFSPKQYRTLLKSPLANINALLHYALIGQHLGLPVIDAYKNKQYSINRNDHIDLRKELLDEDNSGISAIELTEEEWINLAKNQQKPDAATVDVVIPVYRNPELTLNCIYSVLESNNKTPYELTVINDASPEETLTNKLQQLHKLGIFKLVTNQQNLGFVLTANKALTLGSNRDVILLNSDTVVFNNWIDRLQSVAKSDGDIASVTPLSNNATICSYPYTLCDNNAPLEISYELLDEFASSNNSAPVEIPTAIGFCMYVTREAIKQVGVFNFELFGTGYGEENDWSRRAVNAGFRNLACVNTFVRHVGGASFLDQKESRIQSAMATMEKAHPGYNQTIQDYIRRDPLLQARMHLDKSRLINQKKSKNVLFVTHRRGGGTEKHLKEDISRIFSSGCGVFVLAPSIKDYKSIGLSSPICGPTPGLDGYQSFNDKPLISLLKSLDISEIHIHSLIDFPQTSHLDAISLSKALKSTLHIDIHDYETICPRINLIDKEGIYCGEPNTSDCDSCLTHNKSCFDVSNIQTWRQEHRELLNAAKSITVPDSDVSQRLKKYFPDIVFTVSPHDDPCPIGDKRDRRWIINNEALRVVVIGAISSHKGYNPLHLTARYTQKNNLPIDFILMGYSKDDSSLLEAGVSITGKYSEENEQLLLDELSPHLIWLPSTWPETYSYTLSIALETNEPISAFNIGAIASRLKSCGLDQYLMPLEMHGNPEFIANHFLVIRNDLTVN